MKKVGKLGCPTLWDFLIVAKGMIIFTAMGWQDSWDIQEELKFCIKNQIPVFKMKPKWIYEDLSRILWDFIESKSVTRIIDKTLKYP